jgi:cytochrome c5
MTEIHIHEHSSPIKNWKQLLVVAVLAFVVPVFLIIAVVQSVTGGLRAERTLPEMSPEAIAARIKPVGEVSIGAAPAQAVAAPAPGATPALSATSGAAPAGAARPGEQVYQQACAMCHSAGLMGAPRTGDKAAWQPRVAQGKATLYQHAIGGIRTMPAKGGNASLSDAEVKAAVDYLAAKAK